jgi:hypothetical protein
VGAEQASRASRLRGLRLRAKTHPWVSTAGIARPGCEPGAPAVFLGLQPKAWAHVPREIVKRVKVIWPEVVYARAHASSYAASREIPPTRPEQSQDDSPCAF